MTPDPNKAVTAEVAPIHMAVISGTGTGDGGPPIAAGLITTPGSQPNIVVSVISPLMAVAVRFGNGYLTTLVGLLGAAMTPFGDVLPQEFGSLLWTCGQLSFAGAAVGALKDLVTIFSRLEQKFPMLTGSV